MTSDVVQRSDHVEVVGRSGDDVTTALALLDAARARQAQLGRDVEHHLLAAMAAAGVEALPASRAAAAQRLAAHKDDLLSTGAHTYATLAAARGAQESATRTWVSREKHRLVQIKANGRTLLPALQFDDAGRLRDDLAAMTELLLTAGTKDWQLWSWLASPTSLLSGEAPSDVADHSPARALAAAQRYAAEILRRRRATDSASTAEPGDGPGSREPAAADEPARRRRERR